MMRLVKFNEMRQKDSMAEDSIGSCAYSPMSILEIVSNVAYTDTENIGRTESNVDPRRCG